MKKYRFILISNDTEERLELKHAPLGWDKFKISHIKDFTYFGLFSRITSDFEFIFDGYDFLLRQFGKFDIDMDVLLRVYLKKDNTLIFHGKVNMEGFEIDYNNRKFKVDIIESSFVQDFKNREKTKYNIFSEGMPIASIRPKVFKLYSEGSGMEGLNQYNHTLPIIWDLNDNPQVKSGYQVNTSGIDFSDPEASFYHNKKTVPQEITFSISINASVWSGYYQYAYRVVKYDINGNATILYQVAKNELRSRFIDTYSNTLTLDSGDRIAAFFFSNTPSTFNVEYDEDLSITINEDSTFSETTAKCLLPHEAFNDLIYKMTGVENALVSNIFGRTDLGYSVDGDQALQSLTKGTLLRNKEDDEMAIGFMDLFASYNVYGNLGLIVRGEKVYIDTKEDLFEDYIISIGEVSDLKIKPAEDYYFNEITFGYPVKEYEELNGSDEFNTTVNFTNTHRTYGKAFSLISKVRGDGTGAELARRNQESITGTKDTRYDNDLFFLCLERNGTDYRNERIATATGIFSPETSHNLRLAPSQSINRWKKYFGIPSKNYTYQSKEFNSNLKLTINEYTEEGQDFVCDDRYFVPHIKEFNFPVTRELSDEIAAHPLGLIKYTYKGRTYYERLFEINAEDEGMGNFKTIATRITGAEKETLKLLKTDDQNYLKTDDDNYLSYEP